MRKFIPNGKQADRFSIRITRVSRLRHRRRVDDRFLTRQRWYISSAFDARRDGYEMYEIGHDVPRAAAAKFINNRQTHTHTHMYVFTYLRKSAQAPPSKWILRKKNSAHSHRFNARAFSLRGVSVKREKKKSFIHGETSE